MARPTINDDDTLRAAALDYRRTHGTLPSKEYLRDACRCATSRARRIIDTLTAEESEVASVPETPAIVDDALRRVWTEAYRVAAAEHAVLRVSLERRIAELEGDLAEGEAQCEDAERARRDAEVAADAERTRNIAASKRLDRAVRRIARLERERDHERSRVEELRRLLAPAAVSSGSPDETHPS